MAIREREGRKKPFLVYWRNPFTQKIQSKAVETRAEAEKLNAFVQYQLKYEREEFKPEELVPPEPEVQTLESVLYLYLRERNLAKDNLDRTLWAVQAILAKYGDTPIVDIDRQALVAMQQMCILAGNKGSTVHRKLGVIKAAMNWAHRNGFITTLPLFPVSPKCEPARYAPPSQEEIARIYQASPPHLQRVIVLGFMFGLRVGPCELLKLTWEDIDLHRLVIRVPNAKKGIGEPWRDVPIMPNMLGLFQAWQTQDAELETPYVIHYKNKPVANIRTSWAKALERAGISRHIRPYDLRHGFATEAIAAGADYGTVAELMGHKSPMMVLRHYQHVNNRQKMKVMENMPQLNLAVGSV